ncbi:SAGA complex subunit Sgf73, partial [Teratosphaeriaceae sp. CCFEE 6253]
MGAKRGVPGRSAPYDRLLAEYQRRNQARLQKAAFDANAPDPEDVDGEGGGGGGAVDEEAETAAIAEVIRTRFGGAPIFEAVNVPLRRRYEVNRIRGILASAIGDRSTVAGPSNAGGLLGGGGAGGFFGGGGTGFFTGAPTPAPLLPPGPVVDAN